MRQMSFDFGSPVDYGGLQDTVRLFRLNQKLHGIVQQVLTFRDVPKMQDCVRVVLKNGIKHDVPISELFTDETLTVLVLLGASNGSRDDK